MPDSKTPDDSACDFLEKSVLKLSTSHATIFLTDTDKAGENVFKCKNFMYSRRSEK